MGSMSVTLMPSSHLIFHLSNKLLQEWKTNDCEVQLAGKSLLQADCEQGWHQAGRIANKQAGPIWSLQTTWWIQAQTRQVPSEPRTGTWEHPEKRGGGRRRWLLMAAGHLSSNFKFIEMWLAVGTWHGYWQLVWPGWVCNWMVKHMPGKFGVLVQPSACHKQTDTQISELLQQTQD